MPAGTTVAVEVGDQTPTNNLGCAVDKIFGTTVPNVPPLQDPTASLVTGHQVILAGCATGDLISITVTAPSGLKTIFNDVLP
jgi:hypothetical protein